MLADMAVEREGRRVLRLLLAGAWLERRARDFAVVTATRGRARARVEAEMVAVFVARGWLGEDGRLASGGRIWLGETRVLPPDFRQQHGAVETDREGVRRERAGTPLEFLRRLESDGRPFLTPMQGLAAERLEQDFERAQLRPRMTAVIDGMPASGGMRRRQEDQAGAALDAKRRVLDALEAAGPMLGDLLFETVCMARGLNEAERGFGWPQRSGKAILRIALERLAGHYGLVSGRRTPGRIEAWSEAAEAA